MIPLNYALFFAFAIPIGFLLNIPFYIQWLKKQKPNNEVYLYMVRGKFTYLNVLDMIARIERATNQDLRLDRIKIERYFEISKTKKISFSVYRSVVYRLLKEKSFGSPKVLNSIRRMPLYTKVVAIWDLMILLSIINAATVIFLIDFNLPFLSAVFGGLIAGFIPGSIIWLFCHLIFNHTLKYSANKRIKNVSSIPFRIAMAQFWAFTGGLFWKDIYWYEGSSTWIKGSSTGYYGGISSGFGSGGFGGFGGGGFGGFGGGGFGGGGAGGSW